MRPLVVLGCMLAASVSSAAAAATLQPRVMVLPVVDDGVGDDALAEGLELALIEGARKTTPNVARAAASLDDTAAVVGCDPAERSCLDAVAAALNVDQILLPTLRPVPEGAEVELIAITREADPMTRRFTVRADAREEDLAAIQAAVPDLLESESRTKPDLPPPPPPPPQPKVITVEHPKSKLPLYIAIGGGAVLAAGVGGWALAAEKQAQIDKAPIDTAADLDHLASLESSGRWWALGGNLAVAGGGLAVAAGVTWWLTSHGRTEQVVVTPTVAPEGGGVRLEVHW